MTPHGTRDSAHLARLTIVLVMIASGACSSQETPADASTGTDADASTNVDTGGSAGSGSAGTGAAGTGQGGGMAGSGGVTGAAGGGAGTGAVGECTDTSFDGPTCATCTGLNCALGTSGTDGCCGLSSPADRQLCEAAVACFATGQCTSSGDPTVCYCGTAGAACFGVAGAANGPCVAQVVAAAKTSVPAEIQDLFIGPKVPLGRAVNITACRGSLCGAECPSIK